VPVPTLRSRMPIEAAFRVSEGDVAPRWLAPKFEFTKSPQSLPSVQALSAKINLLPKIRNSTTSRPIPPREEGRFSRSSRYVRQGAVDALACETIANGAYDQAAWSCPLDAGVNSRVNRPGGTVTRKPDTPGRAQSKSSTHRAGNAGVISAYLCWPACVSFVCTQGSGCGVHPAFPAPSRFGRAPSTQNPGAIASRQRGAVSIRDSYYVAFRSPDA
jgi:hypothetical protein